MICILASNKLEAERWAAAKGLDEDEWFFPNNEMDLITRKNYHVLVASSAGYLPPNLFEKFFALAKSRGRMK